MSIHHHYCTLAANRPQRTSLEHTESASRRPAGRGASPCIPEELSCPIPKLKVRRQAFLSIELCFFSKEKIGNDLKGGYCKAQPKPKEFIAFSPSSSPGLCAKLGCTITRESYMHSLVAKPGGALTILKGMGECGKATGRDVQGEAFLKKRWGRSGGRFNMLMRMP